jgi:hypothetical protein
MNEHLLSRAQGPISSLADMLCSLTVQAIQESPPNRATVAVGDQSHTHSTAQLYQLLSNIQCSSQVSLMDEVFPAPGLQQTPSPQH